jgi:hypothetical protein
MLQGFGMPLTHFWKFPEIRADLPQFEQKARHVTFSSLLLFPMPLLADGSPYCGLTILRRSPSALGFRLGFAVAHLPLPLYYRYVTTIRNARSANNFRYVTKYFHARTDSARFFMLKLFPIRMDSLRF